VVEAKVNINEDLTSGSSAGQGISAADQENESCDSWWNQLRSGYCNDGHKIPSEKDSVKFEAGTIKESRNTLEYMTIVLTLVTGIATRPKQNQADSSRRP
jgi:hypothetical protein